MHLDGSHIDLDAFCDAARTPRALTVADTVQARIRDTHARVATLADGAPAYGLNTGLGANLNHRLDAAERKTYQRQLLRERAVACGEPLAENLCRGVLLSRVITATSGHSGISPALFDFLCEVYRQGLAPVTPEYGSIGAGDLTQSATAGLALCGEGELWLDNTRHDAAALLSAQGLTAPSLQARDGMVLASHSGVTVSLTAHALNGARTALDMLQHAALLAYLGFDANRTIFAEATNALRHAPGQAETAAWFRRALDGASHHPRQVQEALSFRTVAPVLGAARDALDRATAIWTDELNACADNPVLLDDGQMYSTPNFHNGALALALQTLRIALTDAATGSVQRMQRMMEPERSGLPRYLADDTQAGAGLVPTQKTALALLAEVRQHGSAIEHTALAVSDGVEDVAPLTATAARQLQRQLHPLRLLAGLESRVACRAITLRKPETLGALGAALFRSLPAPQAAFARDIQAATDGLDRFCTHTRQGDRVATTSD